MYVCDKTSVAWVWSACAPKSSSSVHVPSKSDKIEKNTGEGAIKLSIHPNPSIGLLRYHHHYYKSIHVI